MSKIKIKKLEIKSLETEIHLGCYGFSAAEPNTAKIEVQITPFMNVNQIAVYHEEETPETVKEFKIKHDISTDELVDFLNKNYKK